MTTTLSISPSTTIYRDVNGKRIDLRDFTNYTCPKTLYFLCHSDYLETIFQVNSDISRRLLQTIFKNLWEKSLKEKITEKDVIMCLSIITTLIRPPAQDAGASSRYYDRLIGKKVPSPISEKSVFYHFLIKHTDYTLLELLFQEQIMFLLSDVFDISLGHADTYRRAFEKKNLEKLKEYKAEFWQKWKNKASVKDCKEFWEYLILVSGYSFNLSHAVSYSYNTYQTAYIKVYPMVSLAIISNYNADKSKKMIRYIREAKLLKINITLPKLGNCYRLTTPDVDNNVIYLAANSIQGIGAKTANILSKSNHCRDIDSFLDFCAKNSINKAVLKILVDIGFFDNLFSNNITHKKRLSILNKISEFIVYEYQTVQKKFIKKYKKYIYKPKKGEEIVFDDENSLQCEIRIGKKCWDIDMEAKSKYQQFIWEEYYSQLKYLGFPLLELTDIYPNIELESHEKLILVKNIKNLYGKNKWQFCLITDSQNITYFLGQAHLSEHYENSVLKVEWFETPRGLNIKNYELVGTAN